MLVSKPEYLHAFVTGTNDKETVSGYLEELARECLERGYRRVLIEEQLTGERMSIADIFEIVMQGSERARGLFSAIAFVDRNPRGDLMEFAETVAVNRGIPIRTFPSVREAEEWLLGTDEPGREANPADGA
jgi:hypothetical protein